MRKLKCRKGTKVTVLKAIRFSIAARVKHEIQILQSEKFIWKLIDCDPVDRVEPKTQH